MSAADSTLKTMMFLGESQRQAGLDFAANIDNMFGRMSEGIKFASVVNQSMVQSAMNFKQTEMEEYFKNEALKLDARRLALSEKESEARLRIAEKDLDLRERAAKATQDRLDAEDERKNKLESYKMVAGELGAEHARVKGEIDYMESTQKALSFQVAKIEDEITEARKRHDKSPFMSQAQKQQEIDLLTQRRSSLLSQAASISSGLPFYEKKMGELSALVQYTNGMTRTPEDISSSLAEIKALQFKTAADQSSSSAAPIGTTFSSNGHASAPKVSFSQPASPSKIPIPDFGSMPQSTSIPDLSNTFGIQDFKYHIFQVSDDIFDPTFVRDKILPSLTEDQRNLIDNNYIAAQRKLFTSFFTDKSHSTTSPERDVQLESFVKRMSQISNPDDFLNITNVVGDISKAAKDAFDKWKNSNSDTRPSEEDALAKAMEGYFGSDKKEKTDPYKSFSQSFDLTGSSHTKESPSSRAVAELSKQPGFDLLDQQDRDYQIGYKTRVNILKDTQEELGKLDTKSFSLLWNNLPSYIKEEVRRELDLRYDSSFEEVIRNPKGKNIIITSIAMAKADKLDLPN